MNFRNESHKVREKILRIAVPITLGSIATGISSLVDLSMIIKRLEFGGISAEEATAIYGNYTTLAVPMFQVASALLAPISVVLLPHLSSIRAEKKNVAFESVLGIGCELSAFISVPLAFIFFFFPQNLLSMLFKPSSAMAAMPLLRLLSIGVLFLSALFIFNTILEASGHAGLQMISMLIGVFVKIPISYVLISNPNFGIAGAPIGTVVGYAVSMLFSCLCCNLCGVSPALIKSYLRPFLNSALSVFCVVMLSHIFERNFDFRVRNFFILLLFGSFYLMFSYLFGVLRMEKLKRMTNPTKSVA
jgi:stage V sporulation protein B